jgi:putative phosphoribosyl transferase
MVDLPTELRRRGCSRQSARADLPIVNGNDLEVLRLNRAAYACMTAEKRLVVVLRATPSFEEPGKREQVARFAADWFPAHL